MNSTMPVTVAPHSSLDDKTPKNAMHGEKKRIHKLHLNIQKAEQNGFSIDLNAGAWINGTY